MDLEYVRAQLAQRVAATNVEQVGREVGVATMTLYRFVAGLTEQPRDPAWSLMCAAVARRGIVSPDESSGVLVAVRRMRVLLDQLAHEAHAVGLDPVAPHPTPEAAAEAALTPPKRRKRAR
jgi:hypothetical protein